MKRAAALAAAIVAAVGTAAPAEGAAGTPGSQAEPKAPALGGPPAGYRLSSDQAIAISRRAEKVVKARAKYRLRAVTETKDGLRWQVGWKDPDGVERAQVLIDDRSGAILEQWDGFQVAWSMARGYEGAFGRRINALWIWLPLCALFVLPFLDRRRPWRLRAKHLDLLALVSLSVSLALFNNADVSASVPLAYPPLLWLLFRCIRLARRSSMEPPLRPWLPAAWLGVGIVFLVSFKIGLNAANSNVIDVGYAGVIGADQIMDGERIYGNFPESNPRGDTYGPIAYLAYIPFEQALPWSGRWDDLPPAHVAAIAFDLLTLAGLWLLGRKLRDGLLGLTLAWAWAACPWTFYASSTNSNDSLVAMLGVLILLTAAAAPLRGAASALGGLTKFAPLALAPLLAGHRGARDGPLGPVAFAAAFLAVAAAAFVPVLIHGGAGDFYDRTLGFQADRDSPFSIWGLWHLPGALEVAVQAGAVLFALGAALWWRRGRGGTVPGDDARLAALCAAILIALQLGATHWFYLYIVWFLPFLLVAVFGNREPEIGNREPGLEAGAWA